MNFGGGHQSYIRADACTIANPDEKRKDKLNIGCEMLDELVNVPGQYLNLCHERV